MPKFFISSDNIVGNNIIIRGEDAHHISKVLRAKINEQLVLTDSNKTDYTVVVKSFEVESIVTEIITKKPNMAEPSINLTLFQALPKFDKMDMIVQKSVELGVSRIVPIITKRTIARLENGFNKKIERWQKIAKEAAKQSNRGIIPKVEQAAEFNNIVSNFNCTKELGIIPYELELKTKIKNVLKNNNKAVKNISLFVGAEGGFELDEIQKAIANGIVSVTLGPRILRTETAGITVISIIMYELDQL